ncbi:hypothetical protein YC2023_021590 [Brassica napus]
MMNRFYDLFLVNLKVNLGGEPKKKSGSIYPNTNLESNKRQRQKDYLVPTLMKSSPSSSNS